MIDHSHGMVWRQSNYTIGDNFVWCPEPHNRHSKGKNAIIVKKPDKNALLGHVPVALSQIICPMLKDGTIERMTAEITERKASEGTWVLGGGIELPCSYFIYGNRKKKADVRRKLRKAERSLYGIWTTATNKLATESGTEIKFSCDFDGIRFIEILLKNRCCNWFIIINMSLMYHLIIVNGTRYNRGINGRKIY